MSYVGPLVAPPAVNPWDADALIDRVRSVLRLASGDVDDEALGHAVAEACALIDDELDLVTPFVVIPVLLEGAAVDLAVERYRRKDAPFGVADAWSIDGGLVRLSSDPMKGVRGLCAPYKARRGVS